MTTTDLRKLASTWWVPSSAKAALAWAADRIEELEAAPAPVDDRIQTALDNGNTHVIALRQDRYDDFGSCGIPHTLIEAPKKFVQPSLRKNSEPVEKVVPGFKFRIDSIRRHLMINGVEFHLPYLLEDLDVRMCDLKGYLKWR